MTPLQLSVIVPTLNEEVSLPNLLQNLNNQKKKNFEIIIVDGGSTDQTQKKAEEFASSIPLKFIACDRRGLSHQRNFGAEHARGAYLMFLDADTSIDFDATEKVEQYIEEKKSLLYLLFPRPEKPNIIKNVVFWVSTRFIMFWQKMGKPLTFGPGIVIENDFFKKIGGFDEKAYVGEDHGLVISAYKFGVKAFFMPDVKYTFSMRRGTLKIVWQYFLFLPQIFFGGVIYKSPIKYEMGGQNYEKDANPS